MKTNIPFAIEISITPEMRQKLHDIRHGLNSLGHGAHETLAPYFTKKAANHLLKCVDSYYLFLAELEHNGVDLGKYS